MEMADADAPGLLPKEADRLQGSSGAGTVETFALVRCAVQPEWEGKEPYIVTVFQLHDGARLFSTLIDCAPEAVRCGDRMTCTFAETSDAELGHPMFRPAGKTTV
jgi:uncharacterized OB-fold protein